MGILHKNHVGNRVVWQKNREPRAYARDSPETLSLTGTLSCIKMPSQK